MNDDESVIVAALEKARRERLAVFMAEYRELAERHGCDFIARPYIADDGRITCTIEPVSTH